MIAENFDEICYRAKNFNVLKKMLANLIRFSYNPIREMQWRHRQGVKTPPFHGGFVGSNPAGVTIFRSGVSPSGKAVDSDSTIVGSNPATPANLNSK